VLHGGNFYGQHVALASDALANAVITMGIHAERRIARLCNPRLNNGLPPFLQPDNIGLQSGFMGAQVSASALLAEMRTRATPASIQSIPTNGDNQDVVTMGTIGARRTAELLELLNSLLAIDALMIAQAVDLRLEQTPDVPAGEAVTALLDWVRTQVPRLTSDRPLNQDIAQIANTMRRPGTLADRPDWFD
jgi:tyrosine ammonia-lyase